MLAEIITHLNEIEPEAYQLAIQDTVNFTQELADKRYAEVDIKEKDADRFLNSKIKRLEDKLESQKAQAQYRDMAIAIRTTEGDLERTRFEYKTRKQKLQQEKNLAFHIPVLQNICLIIPKQGATLSPQDAETKKKIRNPSERFKEVKIIRQETRYLISDWKTKV